MHAGVPRRRRARPVADAPIDPLLARVDDLTKGWLVSLLEQLPLGRASSVLAADLARDGPRICDAVIRALADDTELRRLGPDGALEQLASRAGDVWSGADAATASGAIDALHGVIWSALRDELSGPEPEQVSELAERLSLVIETVRGATLRPPLAREPSPTEPAGPAQEPSPTEPMGPAEQHRPHPAMAGPSIERSRAAEAGASAAAEGGSRGSGAAQALWIGALEEELARAAQAGIPLALLLAELEESERVAAVEPRGVATATIGRFAQAIRDTVRRPDLLASETESRVWIIARDTGRAGAQALASRIARSVRSAETWRGAPLTISIGIAVLGEDGRDADSLIAAAEESRFAAAASGVPVVLAADEERSLPWERQPPA